MCESTKRDAATVKRQIRGGDWSIGFLIARNVDNSGKGGNTKIVQPVDDAPVKRSSKVSISDFAKISVSRETLARLASTILGGVDQGWYQSAPPDDKRVEYRYVE